MRFAAAAAALTMAAAAAAQIPDASIQLDARLVYRTVSKGDTAVRFYDALGTPSVVRLKGTLEPGLKAVVTQRLQRIANDGDPDQFEEYYVEAVGNWRVGKQFVPFGAGMLLHESAVAVRSETTLIGTTLPIDVALVDAGGGRQRGVVGRVGDSRFGFSAAFGHHFGIAATSLSLVRDPEKSLGVDHGYDRAYGADATQRFGPYAFTVEVVALRSGSTDADKTTNVMEARVTLTPSRRGTVTLGFSRDSQSESNFERASGSFFVTKNVYVEPMVRYKGGRVYDFSLAVHLRI